MPTETSLNLAQQLYIAYYGRPADPAGLQFWASQIDAAGGDLTAVIAAFATSPESVALYGTQQSPEDRVTVVFQNLLGRMPDPEGLAFYTNALNTGVFDNNSVILAILEAAQNEDQTLVDNKVAAATRFTEEVAAGNVQYNTAEAAAVARTFLNQVDATPESLAEAEAAIPAFLNVTNLASTNPGSFAGVIENGVISDLEIIREDLVVGDLETPTTPPTGGGGGGGAPVDNIAPTASISIFTNGKSTIEAGETASVNIIFSEPVAGFTLEDLSVSNGAGTLSSLSAPSTLSDGTVLYTATFTPNARIDDANVVISLANTYSDLAANTGGTAESAPFTVITEVVNAAIEKIEVTIGMNEVQVANGSTTNDTTPTVTGTITQELLDNTNYKVKVFNGSTELGDAVVNGTSWTFTPSGPLPSGPYTLTARVTNAAGDARGATSEASELIVDAAATVVLVAAGDSIQTAVNNAAAGTIIQLVEGDYTGNTLINKKVLIQGAGAGLTNVTAAAGTVFELAAGSSNTELRGMTIESEGNAGNASSIVAQIAGIRDVVIANNLLTSDTAIGSVVYINPSNDGFRVLNNTFEAPNKTASPLLGLEGQGHVVTGNTFGAHPANYVKVESFTPNVVFTDNTGLAAGDLGFMTYSGSAYSLNYIKAGLGDSTEAAGTGTVSVDGPDNSSRDESIKITSTDNTGRVRVNELFTGEASDPGNIRLGDIDILQYDFYVESAGRTDVIATFRLTIDADGDLSTTNDRGDLVFEAAYNLGYKPPQAVGTEDLSPVITGKWFTVDLTAPGLQLWQRANSTNFDGAPNFKDLATWSSEAGFMPAGGRLFNEDSLVLGFNVGFGSFNGAAVIYADNVAIGTAAANGQAYLYDFGAMQAAIPVPPLDIAIVF